MSYLSAYTLSIVGVVLLFIIVELILPNGKSAKYIRSILGIFLIFVIVAPLAKLKNLDFGTFLSDQNITYQLNYDYLYELHLKEAQNLEVGIKSLLKEEGIADAEVIVNKEKESATLQISGIYVDLSRAVISKNDEHIINYTTLRTIIGEYASIDKDKVVIDD